MARSFKQRNELLFSIKCEEFLEQLNYQQLCNNDCNRGAGSVRFVCSCCSQTSAGDVCNRVGSNRLAHIDNVFWAFSVHPSHKYSAAVSYIYIYIYIYIRRRRWVDNIRMDLQEVGCGHTDWIGLAQDRDRWRALVSAVMNLRVQ